MRYNSEESTPHLFWGIAASVGEEPHPLEDKKTPASLVLRLGRGHSVTNEEHNKNK